MSIIGKMDFNSFISGMNSPLVFFMKLLPKDFQSFEAQLETGAFSFYFPQEKLGTVLCEDFAWKATLEKSQFKISQTVTGIFAPDCLSIATGISLLLNFGFLKTEISLEEVRCQDTQTIELVGGKWGQKKSLQIPSDKLNSFSISWT